MGSGIDYGFGGMRSLNDFTQAAAVAGDKGKLVLDSKSTDVLAKGTNPLSRLFRDMTGSSLKSQAENRNALESFAVAIHNKYGADAAKMVRSDGLFKSTLEAGKPLTSRMVLGYDKLAQAETSRISTYNQSVSVSPEKLDKLLSKLDARHDPINDSAESFARRKLISEHFPTARTPITSATLEANVKSISTSIGYHMRAASSLIFSAKNNTDKAHVDATINKLVDFLGGELRFSKKEITSLALALIKDITKSTTAANEAVNGAKIAKLTSVIADLDSGAKVVAPSPAFEEKVTYHRDAYKITSLRSTDTMPGKTVSLATIDTSRFTQKHNTCFVMSVLRAVCENADGKTYLGSRLTLDDAGKYHVKLTSGGKDYDVEVDPNNLGRHASKDRPIEASVMECAITNFMETLQIDNYRYGNIGDAGDVGELLGLGMTTFGDFIPDIGDDLGKFKQAIEIGSVFTDTVATLRTGGTFMTSGHWQAIYAGGSEALTVGDSLNPAGRKQLSVEELFSKLVASELGGGVTMTLFTIPTVKSASE